MLNLLQSRYIAAASLYSLTRDGCSLSNFCVQAQSGDMLDNDGLTEYVWASMGIRWIYMVGTGCRWINDDVMA